MKTYIKENKLSKCSTIELNGNIIVNPTEEEILAAGWVEYVPEENPITLQQVKDNKIKEITDYDTSTEVNSFTYLGQHMWYGKLDRASLYHLASCCVERGLEVMELRHNGMVIELPPKVAQQMLVAIELYASSCFNVTEKHKANIQALESIEEVENYNYREGYPEKLIF